jgi:hypothetical protein
MRPLPGYYRVVYRTYYGLSRATDEPLGKKTVSLSGCYEPPAPPPPSKKLIFLCYLQAALWWPGRAGAAKPRSFWVPLGIPRTQPPPQTLSECEHRSPLPLRCAIHGGSALFDTRPVRSRLHVGALNRRRVHPLVGQVPPDVVCQENRAGAPCFGAWGERDGVRAVADVHPARGTRSNLHFKKNKEMRAAVGRCIGGWLEWSLL